MGTRGIIVYRYKGKYFTRYNQYDSYLEGLGRTLVSFIPADPDAFQRWLEKTRSILASFITYIETGREAPSGSEEDFHEGLYANEFTYSPKAPNTRCDWDAAWAYTYDLDNVFFSVEDITLGIVHLRMDKIHHLSGSDWTKLIYRDSLQFLGRSPYVSDEFYGYVDRDELPLASIRNRKLLEGARPDRIDPNTWMKIPDNDQLSLQRKVAIIATEGLISGLYAKFGDTHGLIEKGTFGTFAKELLTCASPAGSTFSFAYNPKYITIPEEKRNPLGRTFWFRGRLVMLAHWLDRKDIFESYVGAVIRHAREKDLEEFTAILWSIDHVAVVVVSGEKVTYSDAIPIVAALFNDHEKFEQGLRLIARYLPPPCSEGAPQFGGHLSLDIFIRIMEFADTESTSMLGKTSKALRIEWLKRPSIGHYTLLSVKDADRGFLAIDSRKADAVETTPLTFLPPMYVPHDEWTEKGSYDFDRSFLRDMSTRIEHFERANNPAIEFRAVSYVVETPNQGNYY